METDENNTSVRRTSRARKVNPRFANDDIDEGYMKMVGRITASNYSLKKEKEEKTSRPSTPSLETHENLYSPNVDGGDNGTHGNSSYSKSFSENDTNSNDKFNDSGVFNIALKKVKLKKSKRSLSTDTEQKDWNVDNPAASVIVRCRSSTESEMSEIGSETNIEKKRKSGFSLDHKNIMKKFRLSVGSNDSVDQSIDGDFRTGNKESLSVNLGCKIILNDVNNSLSTSNKFPQDVGKPLLLGKVEPYQPKLVLCPNANINLPGKKLKILSLKPIIPPQSVITHGSHLSTLGNSNPVSLKIVKKDHFDPKISAPSAIHNVCTKAGVKGSANVESSSDEEDDLPLNEFIQKLPSHQDNKMPNDKGKKQQKQKVKTVQQKSKASTTANSPDQDDLPLRLLVGKSKTFSSGISLKKLKGLNLKKLKGQKEVVKAKKCKDAKVKIDNKIKTLNTNERKCTNKNINLGTVKKSNKLRFKFPKKVVSKDPPLQNETTNIVVTVGGVEGAYACLAIDKDTINSGNGCDEHATSTTLVNNKKNKKQQDNELGNYTLSNGLVIEETTTVPSSPVLPKLISKKKKQIEESQEADDTSKISKAQSMKNLKSEKQKKSKERLNSSITISSSVEDSRKLTDKKPNSYELKVSKGEELAMKSNWKKEKLNNKEAQDSELEKSENSAVEVQKDENTGDSTKTTVATLSNNVSDVDDLKDSTKKEPFITEGSNRLKIEDMTTQCQPSFTREDGLTTLEKSEHILTENKTPKSEGNEKNIHSKKSLPEINSIKAITKENDIGYEVDEKFDYSKDKPDNKNDVYVDDKFKSKNKEKNRSHIKKEVTPAGPSEENSSIDIPKFSKVKTKIENYSYEKDTETGSQVNKSSREIDTSKDRRVSKTNLKGEVSVEKIKTEEGSKKKEAKDTKVPKETSENILEKIKKEKSKVLENQRTESPIDKYKNDRKKYDKEKEKIKPKSEKVDIKHIDKIKERSKSSESRSSSSSSFNKEVIPKTEKDLKLDLGERNSSNDTNLSFRKSQPEKSKELISPKYEIKSTKPEVNKKSDRLELSTKSDKCKSEPADSPTKTVKDKLQPSPSNKVKKDMFGEVLLNIPLPKLSKSSKSANKDKSKRPEDIKPSVQNIKLSSESKSPYNKDSVKKSDVRQENHKNTSDSPTKSFNKSEFSHKIKEEKERRSDKYKSLNDSKQDIKERFDSSLNYENRESKHSSRKKHKRDHSESHSHRSDNKDADRKRESTSEKAKLIKLEDKSSHSHKKTSTDYKNRRSKDSFDEGINKSDSDNNLVSVKQEIMSRKEPSKSTNIATTREKLELKAEIKPELIIDEEYLIRTNNFKEESVKNEMDVDLTSNKDQRIESDAIQIKKENSQKHSAPPHSSDAFNVPSMIEFSTDIKDINVQREDTISTSSFNNFKTNEQSDSLSEKEDTRINDESLVANDSSVTDLGLSQMDSSCKVDLQMNKQHIMIEETSYDSNCLNVDQSISSAPASLDDEMLDNGSKSSLDISDSIKNSDFELEKTQNFGSNIPVIGNLDSDLVDSTKTIEEKLTQQEVTISTNDDENSVNSPSSSNIQQDQVEELASSQQSMWDVEVNQSEDIGNTTIPQFPNPPESIPFLIENIPLPQNETPEVEQFQPPTPPSPSDDNSSAFSLSENEDKTLLSSNETHINLDDDVEDEKENIYIQNKENITHMEIGDEDSHNIQPRVEVTKPKELTPEEKAEKEKLNKKIVEERMKSFELLPENLYLVEKVRNKRSKEARRMVCDCTLTKEEILNGEMGCGDDCLNRLLMIECGSRCPLKDRCTNKMFQQKQYANIEVFNAEEKGCGVRVCDDIKMGDFIMEYIGEVFDTREFKRRRKEYARESSSHFYFMALRADRLIDSTRKGSISRFINHSCSPNAETQKWTVNGDVRIGFFATRDIVSNEEINFDYRLERYGREPQKCYCGTPLCRGWLGEAPDQKTKEEKEEDRRRELRDRQRRENKRSFFDDMDLEDEIEKLSARGLRTRQDTLTFSRLMVRCEDASSRHGLLQILKEAEKSSKRLFLDYHGLKILWSWMVDISSSADTFPLKVEILKTLDCLPITNKTQLLDSKVMSVIEKWSKEVPKLQAKKEEDHPRHSVYVTKEVDVVSADKKSSDGSEDSDTEAAESKESGDPSPVDSATPDESKESGDPSHVDSASPDESSQDSTVMEGDSSKSTPVLEEENTTPKPALNPQSDELEGEKPKEEGEDAMSSSVVVEEKETSELEEDQEESPTPSNEEEKEFKSSPSTSEEGEDKSQPSLTPSPEDDSSDTSSSTSTAPEEVVVQLAAKLLSVWRELKEAFKIPKKERIQMMKEHERQVDREYDNYLKRTTGTFDGWPKSSYDSWWTTDRDRKRDRDRDRDRQRRREWDRERERAWKRRRESEEEESGLSKEERRERFAQQVAKEDEERQKKLQEEMWKLHLERCSLLGHDPYYTPIFDPSGHFYWDPEIQTWQPYIGPNPNLPVPATYYIIDPMNGVGSAPAFNQAMMPGEIYSHTPQSEGESSLVNTPEGDTGLNLDLSNIPLPGETSVLPPVPPQLSTIPLPGEDDMDIDDDRSDGVQSPYVGSPWMVTICLPQGWKMARDDHRRLYFYHTKTRHTQWDSPTEDLHKTLLEQYEIDSDSESDPETDSDSSTESDSEEFSSDEDETELDKTDKDALVQKSETLDEKMIRRPRGAKGRRCEKLVQERVISPILHEDKEAARRERREAKEKARHDARKERYTKERYNLYKALKGGPGPVSVLPGDTMSKGDDYIPGLSPSGPGDDAGDLSSPNGAEWDTDNGDEISLFKLSKRTKSGVKVKVKGRVKTAMKDSSELARKIKDQFRSRMATYIVSVLNPYRKPECKRGRITSNEDFKYLARKLTHFVMLKELKQVPSIEELECSESVKHKTKEFVRKYMAKYGDSFQRDPNDTKEY